MASITLRGKASDLKHIIDNSTNLNPQKEHKLIKLLHANYTPIIDVNHQK